MGVMSECTGDKIDGRMNERVQQVKVQATLIDGRANEGIDEMYEMDLPCLHPIGRKL